MKPPVKRCAVYTRKSSEEGLEQDFNSLDAQREACLAYVTSQKAEGWTVVKAAYDDGGFSGGNMERPGLQKLLEDISTGKIDIIVVYKIDRLTRSLMDFAKLVEVFDKHQVTFVSVTQSFNTTTSMGRLTLNVLLSFAQFEREVTGERIRDKIAASKKKGIWMGGTVPLGYDVQNRALIANAKEAVLVKEIFEDYLKIGSVPRLKDLLDKKGRRTKSRHPFTRGMLYSLLANPVYIGKLRYKQQVYDGLHRGILDEGLWSAAQKKLQSHPVPRGQAVMRQEFLLQGLLHDEEGIIYSPVFTTKKKQRYRYYVSRRKIHGGDSPDDSMLRLPAQEIEDFVEQALRDRLGDTQVLARILDINHDAEYQTLQKIAARIPALPKQNLIKTVVHRISVCSDSVKMTIHPPALTALLHEAAGMRLNMDATKEVDEIIVPLQTGKSWKGSVVIRPPTQGSPEDIFSLPPYELKNLIRGMIWRDEHFNGMTIREIAKREKSTDAFVGRLVRNTFEIA